MTLRVLGQPSLHTTLILMSGCLQIKILDEIPNCIQRIIEHLMLSASHCADVLLAQKLYQTGTVNSNQTNIYRLLLIQCGGFEDNYGVQDKKKEALFSQLIEMFRIMKEIDRIDSEKAFRHRKRRQDDETMA